MATHDQITPHISTIKKKQIGAQPPQPTIGSSSGSVTDSSVGPASVMVGNLVQGNRLAIAQGRDIGLADDAERKVSCEDYRLCID